MRIFIVFVLLFITRICIAEEALKYGHVQNTEEYKKKITENPIWVEELTDREIMILEAVTYPNRWVHCPICDVDYDRKDFANHKKVHIKRKP